MEAYSENKTKHTDTLWAKCCVITRQSMC